VKTGNSRSRNVSLTSRALFLAEASETCRLPRALQRLPGCQRTQGTCKSNQHLLPSTWLMVNSAREARPPPSFRWHCWYKARGGGQGQEQRGGPREPSPAPRDSSCVLRPGERQHHGPSPGRAGWRHELVAHPR